MRPAWVVLLALALVGCETKKDTPKPRASAAAASSAAPKPKPPWYLGHWSGAYAADKQNLGEMEGPEREWATDEGGTASGLGKLSLDISEDSHVTGKVTGPLGDMTARGTLDGDLLRIRLLPAQRHVDAFNGLVIAHRQGKTDTFEGKLHASSGDSVTVRNATVKLVKGDTPPKLEIEKPAPPPPADAGATDAAKAK